MSKELFVRMEDNTKRSIYLAKELLKSGGNELKVISSHYGASVVSRVCHALSSMNYVTITNIETETSVKDGKRKIRLIVTINKTSEFDKLYEENQLKRKEYDEKRAKEQGEVTKA